MIALIGIAVCLGGAALSDDQLVEISAYRLEPWQARGLFWLAGGLLIAAGLAWS